MKLIVIGLAIAIIVVVGSNGNPVAVDKVESEITQPGDLETSESILKIIEKKIAHWLKKCYKHGGCQSDYGHDSYGYDSYGHGSSYGGSSYGGGYGGGYGGPSYGGSSYGGPSYGGGYGGSYGGPSYGSSYGGY